MSGAGHLDANQRNLGPGGRSQLTGFRRVASIAAALILLDAEAIRVLPRCAASETRLVIASAPAPDLSTRTGRAEALFLRLLEGERGDDLEAGWRALGFGLHPGEANDVIMLWDYEGHRGQYALRGGRTWPLALQAPHRFFDGHTGTIAEQMFAEGGFAAAAWNTTPRRTKAAGEKGSRDLAHLRRTYFNAFTRAFGRVHRDGLVVQLHGFARDKRSTEAGRTADLILSDATRSPGPAALAAADCLRRKMPGVVRLYPAEVRELGGTTNANAAALRDLGLEGSFLHVEMSLDLRLRLRDEADLRQRFSVCLVDSLQTAAEQTSSDHGPTAAGR
jgi:hypothetical protein